MYDPAKNWTRSERAGKPVPRPKGTETPCRSCPKIQHGDAPTPANGRKAELTAENWQAYQHYLRCKAVNRFPDDPIVTRNAGLIRMIEDYTGARRQERLARLLEIGLTKR